LKEFDNRWYLIGYSENHGEVRTFGIDRISDPELLVREFEHMKHETRFEYLNDVYGVFPMKDRKKTEITIYANELSTHFFHAYPLHESQNMQKNSEGDSIITFQLIPSIELARYLLAQGSNVEILSPQWFKEETEKLKS
jgi:predicted DNA-binding transcriptional regulator YafY